MWFVSIEPFDDKEDTQQVADAEQRSSSLVFEYEFPVAIGKMDLRDDLFPHKPGIGQAVSAKENPERAGERKNEDHSQ